MGELARSVTPEVLDLLQADDPRAVASRHDLARINFVMRHEAIMARRLAAYAPPRVLLDLGSGDGRFLLGVAKRMAPRWQSVRALIADQRDLVSRKTRTGFASLGWSCEILVGDVFDGLARLDDQVDIVTANLFLHHFDSAALARLLMMVKARSLGFVACEPRRSMTAFIAARMVFALGCNDVTRHDAVASVRAGFKGKELSELWSRGDGWSIDERATRPFSHVFTAVKHAG